MRFVLASTSPARLAVLAAAGIACEPVAPQVDEEATVAAFTAERGQLSAAETVLLLAEAKRDAVIDVLAPVTEPTLVFGGDSAFEHGGEIHGKPRTIERARVRWLAQRGTSGQLHSGHALALLKPGAAPLRCARASSANVHFAAIDDEALEAYLATGEALEVAGAFKLEGFAAAFIDRIDGDPSTVTGLSLPTLRALVRELGVRYESLWRLSA